MATHASTPTPTPRPIPPVRRDQTTQPNQVNAPRIAERIREHLAGRLSREELSQWAVTQFVKQDFSHWYEPRQVTQLLEALGALMTEDQARGAEADRLFLENLAAKLEAGH